MYLETIVVFMMLLLSFDFLMLFVKDSKERKNRAELYILSSAFTFGIFIILLLINIPFVSKDLGLMKGNAYFGEKIDDKINMDFMQNIPESLKTNLSIVAFLPYEFYDFRNINNKNFIGLYNNEENTMLVSTRYKTEIPEIYYHEMGHHVWYTKLTESQRDRWKVVYDKSWTQDFVSAYAETSVEEDFAETFMFYIEFDYIKHQCYQDCAVSQERQDLMNEYMAIYKG